MHLFLQMWNVYTNSDQEYYTPLSLHVRGWAKNKTQEKILIMQIGDYPYTLLTRAIYYYFTQSLDVHLFQIKFITNQKYRCPTSL